MAAECDKADIATEPRASSWSTEFRSKRVARFASPMLGRPVTRNRRAESNLDSPSGNKTASPRDLTTRAFRSLRLAPCAGSPAPLRPAYPACL